MSRSTGVGEQAKKVLVMVKVQVVNKMGSLVVALVVDKEVNSRGCLVKQAVKNHNIVAEGLETMV